jgi:hypothetical protein
MALDVRDFPVAITDPTNMRAMEKLIPDDSTVTGRAELLGPHRWVRCTGAVLIPAGLMVGLTSPAARIILRHGLFFIMDTAHHSTSTNLPFS